MYATTPEFLALFGLKDLESLPDLEELRALEGINYGTSEREAENNQFAANIPPEETVASSDAAPAESNPAAPSPAGGDGDEPEDGG
jgi:hypothetical protein